MELCVLLVHGTCVKDTMELCVLQLCDTCLTDVMELFVLQLCDICSESRKGRHSTGKGRLLKRSHESVLQMFVTLVLSSGGKSMVCT